MNPVLLLEVKSRTTAEYIPLRKQRVAKHFLLAGKRIFRGVFCFLLISWVAFHKRI